MSWSDNTPKQPRPDNQQSSIREKQVAFLQAIHAFCEDPAIKKITDDFRDRGISAVMKAVKRLEQEKPGRGKYIVDRACPK